MGRFKKKIFSMCLKKSSSLKTLCHINWCALSSVPINAWKTEQSERRVFVFSLEAAKMAIYAAKLKSWVISTNRAWNTTSWLLPLYWYKKAYQVWGLLAQRNNIWYDSGRDKRKSEASLGLVSACGALGDHAAILEIAKPFFVRNETEEADRVFEESKVSPPIRFPESDIQECQTKLLRRAKAKKERATHEWAVFSFVVTA